MLVEKYYSEVGQEVRVSRQQASDFAKNIADDFNPIHDVQTKRFCVPGDLLFWDYACQIWFELQDGVYLLWHGD